MPQSPAWFERRFPFGEPVHLYPTVLVRLRGTPARIADLLDGVDAARLTAKPGGTWSIQENVGHLLDLEALWLQRVDDCLAGRDVLTAADLTNRATDQAGFNDRPLGEIEAAFRRARQALVDRVEALPADAFALTSRHPRLGTPMRLVDHLRFVAEHDDHHLARIVELLKG